MDSACLPVVDKELATVKIEIDPASHQPNKSARDDKGRQGGKIQQFTKA